MMTLPSSLRQEATEGLNSGVIFFKSSMYFNSHVENTLKMNKYASRKLSQTSRKITVPASTKMVAAVE